MDLVLHGPVIHGLFDAVLAMTRFWFLAKPAKSHEIRNNNNTRALY
jgi:hypothetical protein